MPEGPSLVIAREKMAPFRGRKVLAVSGNSKIEKERMLNKKLVDIKSWGKHLLFCFNGFTVLTHFLMFGSYYVNDTKDAVPRLHLKFSGGEINLYSCAVRIIEEPLDEVYDWTADVMNDAWNPRAALKKLKAMPLTLVTDALLDQTVFSGVGNIIKNEVLYRIKVHPKNRLGDLPPKKLSKLVKQARQYSFDFLEWKKEYTLRKHWLVHTKKTCPRDGEKINKEYLGITNRRTFFCNGCQVYYGKDTHDHPKLSKKLKKDIPRKKRASKHASKNR